jgi:hypothetical protein
MVVGIHEVEKSIVERFSVLKAIIMEEEVVILDMAVAVLVPMDMAAVEVGMEVIEVIEVIEAVEVVPISIFIVGGGLDREIL